jgi:osmotically-inducible protein OsmY
MDAVTLQGADMRTDSDIMKDVTAELRWEPGLRDDDIAIGVRDGIVTLAGFVDSYADKWRAERVVARVKGVRAVANDLEVKLPSSAERADPEIARAAVSALEWNVLVPHDRIKATVEKGWVTLEGDVDYYYQAEEAERTVRQLTGVKGVTNLITVRTQPTSEDIKQRIREALQRTVESDAERISVEVDGHKVTLKGTVRSYAELKDAERAARNAPGVTQVENRLTVDPNVYSTV